MIETKGQRAAIYCRVSTKDQSPQMQLDVLREFAARRELEIVEEFVDRGVSGTRDSRPGLNRLMDAARKKRIDVVLVYRFDRFARNVRHLVAALSEFEGLGVAFLSFSENLDTATPMGRAMFAIIGALAQLERDLIVERCIEGQRRARARGKRVGRPRAAVDTARVEELHAMGSSVRAIAKAIGVSRSVVERVLATRQENTSITATGNASETPRTA